MDGNELKIEADGVRLSVDSDLYDAGPSMNGGPFLAEIYIVVAECLDGSRFEHRTRFPGARREMDDEGFDHYADIRDEASKNAHALMQSIQDGGVIDLASWRERAPVYGSQAYQTIHGCPARERG